MLMERFTTIIDGLQLSIIKGKDVPIVYIHCAGGDATFWRNQIEEIGGYAIDLPEHGESSAAEIYSLDDYAYFAAKFIKKYLGSSIIAGHSMGGAVVQRIYLEYESIVEGMILIGTGARLRVLPEILEGLKVKPEETARFIAKLSSVNDEIIEDLSRKFRERAKVLLLDLQLCDKFDLLEKYKNQEIKIDVPTLIIVGEKDELTPPKYAKFFHDHIPYSELIVVPDAGHMVMIERPDVVNDAIKKFIKKVTGDEL